MKTNAYDFWARVDELRQDMPLMTVARLIGLNYATIKDKRTRGAYPRIDLLPVLADVLGTTIDYLLTGKERDESLSPEISFILDHPEARDLVRLMMADPSILPHLSALVLAGRATAIKEQSS